jgi:hypothetical protein
MNRTSILKCYTLAKLALADANAHVLFAPSKAQAMRDLNFWRIQLQRANANSG